MRGNAGVIGERVDPSYAGTGGLWSLGEVYQARRLDAWPGPINPVGLRIYLDAGVEASYPSSGTTWTNLVAGNSSATSTGITFNGSTAYFDGGDYATMASSSSYSFTTAQTIFLVLKPQVIDGNRRNPYAQAYGGFGTITEETNGEYNYFYGSSGANSTPYESHRTTFSVGASETACICHTRSGTTLKWFKNGTLTGSKTGSIGTAVAGNTIYIGTGYTNPYYGDINLVAVYDRALTNTEVQNNYLAIKDRFGIA